MNENMRKKRSASLEDNKENLTFEIVVDDILIYDILSRKRPI